MMIHINHITDQDIRGISASIGEIVTSTKSASIITKDESFNVESVEALCCKIKHWPIFWGKPWILVGGKKPAIHAEGYSHLFDDASLYPKCEEIISSLLDSFDWVFFAYFATYQSGLYVYATSNAEFQKKFHLFGLRRSLYLNSSDKNYLRYTCNASVDDQDIPGELAFDLSAQTENANPYLICEFPQEQKQSPVSSLSKDWRIALLERSKVLKAFTIKYGNSIRKKYLVIDPVNHDLYSQMWSRTGSDDSFATHAISRDSDLSKIEALLKYNAWLDITESRNEFGSWIYGPVYGGGSDEYHGLFHAKNPELTNVFTGLCGKNIISRF